MNTTNKLPEHKKETLYSFESVTCMNSSVDTSVGTDPTTPSTLTTTHLLTDL